MTKLPFLAYGIAAATLLGGCAAKSPGGLASAKPVPQYRLKVISFSADGINDKGEMFGTISTGKKNPASQRPDRATERLAIWQSGKMRDLGTLTGADYCQPIAINNRGEIVGTVGPYAMGPGDTSPEAVHLFLWSGGKMHDLGSNGEAVGINDAGQVVGQKAWPDGQHGFLYSRGNVQEIKNPLSTEFSEIKAINAKGQMVGVASGPGKRTGPQPSAVIHTFLWNSGVPVELRLPEHSGLSPYGGAMAINDGGQVVINADILDEAGAEGGHGILSRC